MSKYSIVKGQMESGSVYPMLVMTQYIVIYISITITLGIKWNSVFVCIWAIEFPKYSHKYGSH